MNKGFSIDTETTRLIQGILKGKESQDRVLQTLILQEELNNDIKVCTLKMGGSEDDALSLFDDLLIGLAQAIHQLASPGKKINYALITEMNESDLNALTKEIYGAVFSDKQSLHEYIINKIKERWCEKLGEQATLRQQVMQYVAKDDNDLKKRIITKMKSMNCSEDEARDFYNEGFLQLEKKLEDQNYKGGDVKGFFFTLCTNLKLNDWKKKKPDLPGETTQLDRQDHSTEKDIILNEQKALLKEWLTKLGYKCQQTLQLWNDGFSMAEIAEKVGYKNAAQAGLARFRCMENLTNLIEYQLWMKTDQNNERK